MEHYIKEAQEKLNKYGCKPSEDVCMKHQQPLIDFGFCEYAPNVKEYIATLLTEARKKWLEREMAYWANEVRLSRERLQERPDSLVYNGADLIIEEQISRLEAELKALSK